MVKISAFKSLRPMAHLVDKVITKAYSNYSKTEIKNEITNNKYSFLNIINSNSKENTQTRFQNIRRQINKFKKHKILIEEMTSCLYVYRQSNKQHNYIGIICTINLQDCEDQKIKIHEKTIKKREELFSKYLSITKLHAEPVLLTYDKNTKCVKQRDISTQTKLYECMDQDGVKHEIWRIEDLEKIRNIISRFEKIDNLYIADGHHRMASSWKDKKNKTCLAYILPKKALKTYPFHRVISTKKKQNVLIEKINKHLKIQKITHLKKHSQNLQCYIDKKWWEIIRNKEIEKDILKQLSVSRLSTNILKPIFNIKDERTNKNIRFIAGNKSIKKLIDMLKENEILFLMQEINMNTIIEIANKNYTTPPKSTFILPKIPSGLIMMELT